MGTVASNDPIAIASGGMFRTANPAAPSLSITTGTNSVTATIDGEAGCTNYLKYKSSSQASWQDGGSRSGDGDIEVSGLENDVLYLFVAYSINPQGLVSLPSTVVTVSFAEAAENEYDDLLSDTANDFLSVFGETITYLPYGGDSREITAIVDREPPAELAGMPGVHSAQLTISVANDSTEGISSSEINVSKDKIEVSVRMGETAVEKLITNIISQDVGMMMLGVK